MEDSKQKTKLSQERLEKLKLAREKALAKKRELKEISEKEKAIKQKEYEKRKEEVNKKYEEVNTKIKESPIEKEKEKTIKKEKEKEKEKMNGFVDRIVIV